MQVIPAINAPDLETAEKQIGTAAGFFSDLPSEALAKEGWIHLDITDGVFSPAQLWGSPEELQKMFQVSSFKFQVEAHLMVSNPEGVIDSWLRTGLVKRVIVHLEAMTDSVYILAKCRKYNAECMLAINPGTEAERLIAHKDDFRYFQLLGVTPGRAGQRFSEKTLEKIKFLKKNVPNATIEVDGGVNSETAGAIKKAGADILVSASHIFGSDNPKKAYEELKNARTVARKKT